jgi:O-antigen/teichoic acid export membrane protein
MHRKFITNLGLILLLNIVIKPVWIFGIDRTVQNIVSTGEYGFYSIILNLTFTFYILLDLGITSFNNKNIAQNHFLLHKHVSRILLLKILLGLLFFVVVFIAGFWLGFDKHHYYFLIFLSINQFLVSFILYLRSNISGLLMFRTDSVISVLDRLLMIIICAFLLWGRDRTDFQIIWFVYAQTAAYVITAIIAFLLVRKKSGMTTIKWDPVFSLMILKKSAPYAILILLMAFYNRFDAVMISKILGSETGNEQAGIYASAFRLLDAVNMIAYLFSVLLLPMFAKLISDKAPFEWLVKLSYNLLLVISVTFAIISSFYSTEIMNLLYVKHIDESAEVFRWLILGFIPISVTYVFGTLLTSNGSLKQLNIVATIGMVMNISLNLILIPQFKAAGSAYASIITQLVTAALQFVVAKHIFNFEISLKTTLTSLFFILGVLIMAFLSKRFGSNNWIIGYCAAGFGSVLLAFIFKLFSVSEIRALVQKVK